MYTASTYKSSKQWVASLKMTVPDYSINFYVTAIRGMKHELERLNVKLAEPEYIYVITNDDHDRIELVDIDLVIAVEKPGPDNDHIQFRYIEETSEMLRIEADTFDDVHIAMAEWMHEHDYKANGDLRRILHAGTSHIYECPVRKSDS